MSKKNNGVTHFKKAAALNYFASVSAMHARKKKASKEQRKSVWGRVKDDE